MEKIAIIGMGIGGMGVLLSYEKENLNKGHEIDCYDYKKSTGRGFPFRKDSDQVLLNARPETISYDYEKPTEFSKWLEKNDYTYKEYVPRHVLGDYLYKRYSKTLEDLGGKYIGHPAIDLDYLEDENKFVITDRDGKKRSYDRVHLCCGQIPPQDFYDLKDTDNYIHDMYPLKDKLKDIASDTKICIIGTGLSGIDVSRYLLEVVKIKELVIFSRGLVFPSVRKDLNRLETMYFTQENVDKIIESNKGYITFEEVDNLIMKELKNHKISFGSLMNKYNKAFEGLEKSLEYDEGLMTAQNLFTNFTNPLNTMWLALSRNDKKKFMEKYDDYIQIFGGPTPQSTGEIITKKKEEGIYQVLDNIDFISYNDENKKYYLLDEDKRVVKIVDYVINSTGVDKSLKSLNNGDFLEKILNKELIQVDENGGLTVVKDSLNVLSPRFGELYNLHAHGVLISGVQLRNNSISTIQESAHRCVKTIYKE